MLRKWKQAISEIRGERIEVNNRIRRAKKLGKNIILIFLIFSVAAVKKETNYLLAFWESFVILLLFLCMTSVDFAMSA